MTIKAKLLADYIPFILNHIPEILVTKKYRTKLIKIGETLPPLHHGAIELHELPHDPRTDLMVCAFNEFNEHRILEKWPDNKEISIPRGWDIVQDFCKLWCDNNHLLSDILDNIYIVYDNKPNIKNLPQPWFYLAFGNLRLDKNNQWDLYMKCSSLLPGKLNSQTGDLLKICFDATKSSIWVFGFGLLKSRGMNGMRIGICGFKTIKEIINYLIRVKWSGNILELSEKLSFMEGNADFYVLSLDLVDKILPRIGIECMPGRPNNVPKAKRTLNAMSKKIGYDNERAKAAISWIGTDTFKINSGSQIRSERWLDHIKLLYSPDQLLGIKTYLFYNCYPHLH